MADEVVSPLDVLFGAIRQFNEAMLTPLSAPVAPSVPAPAPVEPDVQYDGIQEESGSTYLPFADYMPKSPSHYAVRSSKALRQRSIGGIAGVTPVRSMGVVEGPDPEMIQDEEFVVVTRQPVVYDLPPDRPVKKRTTSFY